MRNALIFLLISSILTLAIGAGLSRLQFKPGMPLPSFNNGNVVLTDEGSAPAGMRVSAFARTIFLVLLAVMALFLVVHAALRVPWKRLLPKLFSIFWKIMLACAVVAILLMTLLPASHTMAPAEPLPEPKPLAYAPLGPVPTGLLWLVAIGLFVMALLLGVWVVIIRRRRAPSSWERDIEIARQDLLSGNDLAEVIMRCYRRMSQTLGQEQHLEREASMTTGEFEMLLASRGVPEGPVRNLTRLFEAVRYGRRRSSPEDERMAVGFLDDILAYSRRARRKD